jgi:hypothetical protein
MFIFVWAMLSPVTLEQQSGECAGKIGFLLTAEGAETFLSRFQTLRQKD